MFGATGDGVTDDTTAIKNAFLKGGHIVFTEGTYLVNEDINVLSNTYVEFKDGAILKRKATNEDTYFMFNVVNKNNITFKNVHLIGDRDSHTGTTGEWGYGFNICSSQHINILDCVIEKTWGDGIYIGYSYYTNPSQEPKFITVENSKILNCSRNGISLCSGEEIIVRNTYITGSNRTNPKAGIDIETEGPADTTPYLKNIIIDHVTTEVNNIGIGVSVSNHNCENINISNHLSIGESSGFCIWNLNSSGTINYENSKIVKCYSAGILVANKSINNHLLLKNIIVDTTLKSDTTHNFNGTIVFIVDTDNQGNVTIDNVDFIKTYKGYSFTDLICFRSDNGSDYVMKNIKIKNIDTTNYLSCKYADTETTELVNANFKSKSDYYTINLDEYSNFNKIIIDKLVAHTTRNIKSTALDGEYEVQTGLKNGYSLNVVFDSDFSIYNGNDTKTGNTYALAGSGAKLKFRKSGNNIFIIDNNGFN